MGTWGLDVPCPMRMAVEQMAEPPGLSPWDCPHMPALWVASEGLPPCNCATRAVPTWLSPCGVPMRLSQRSYSTEAVPMWCPHGVTPQRLSPCGVPMWCPQGAMAMRLSPCGVPMGLWLIGALLTLSSHRSHSPTSSARPLHQHRLHQPGDRPGGPHAHRHLSLIHI